MKHLVLSLATAAVLLTGSVQAATPRFPDGVRPVVNVNTATLAQLQFLPHVGPSIAGQIVTFRAAHGHFHRISDLYAVPHLGVKSVTRFAPYVTFDGPTTATAKIHAGGGK